MEDFDRQNLHLQINLQTLKLLFQSLHNIPSHQLLRHRLYQMHSKFKRYRCNLVYDSEYEF